MALFKIFKGSNTAKITNSSVTGYITPTDGYAYYDTSSKLFYIDADYNNDGIITRKPINANESIRMPYIIGTGTAAVTTSGSYNHTKWEANIPGVDTLETGIYFVYKVPIAGHASYGIGLNVNQLGYHPVVSQITTATGTRYGVNANILVIYDEALSAKIYINNVQTTVQGCWVVINDYDSGNTVPAAYCSTSASTAAKTATCSGYVALAKSFIHVIITTSNSSKNKLTLNINSKGAKTIYINGTISSSSNYTLPAGSYLVYYDGTNYYFRTDGLLTADITGNAATATKANQDSAGNDIVNTYLTKAVGVTDIRLDTTNNKIVKKINNSESDVIGIGSGLSINNTQLVHITPNGASTGVKGNTLSGAHEFIKTIETDAFGHVVGFSTEALTIYDGSTSSDLEVFDNTSF